VSRHWLFLIALLAFPGLVSAQSRGAFVLDTGDGTEQVTLYGASYALVIGNDAYTNGWPRLANAGNDARAVARELELRGFEDRKSVV